MGFHNLEDKLQYARRSHECTRCGLRINTGERYTRTVILEGNMVIVTKEHFPMCPPERDYEEYVEKEMQDLEDKSSKEYSLPLAA